MKTPFPTFRTARHASFTLVELLVVIGIIAILAAVLFPAISAALNAAKRAKAANMANQISTGVQNYYTEYSVYPIPFGATAGTDYALTNGTAADATPWENITYALCGNINPATGATTSGGSVTNSHSVAFLSLKKSDVDGNGVPTLPISPSATYIYFSIAMDGNYDGILGNNGSANNAIPALPLYPTQATNIITAGTAVWANCNTSLNSTNGSFYVKTF